MPQTRMFRDRVVSMEQTLERGEKHLDFLKGICKEVFPEFQYRGHSLDHERDLFVMNLEAPDGRQKAVCWTRMVLFDAERLPSLLEDHFSPLGARLREFLRGRASRPEIIVTFRHLEEGWIETPEPRREKRRRRRRDRGRQGGRREGAQTLSGRSQAPVASRPAASGAAQPSTGEATPSAAAGAPPSGERRRRRRRFRRRRGRGGGSSSSGSSPPGTS